MLALADLRPLEVLEGPTQAICPADMLLGQDQEKWARDSGERERTIAFSEMARTFGLRESGKK